MTTRRYPIRFDAWYLPITWMAFLPPRTAWVEVGAGEVEVRMGWAFRARFPRQAVRAAAPEGLRTPSRGVHGFGGRWLVNGSGQGIVRVELAPPARARLLGVLPIALRTLLVSVEQPEALVSALLA